MTQTNKVESVRADLHGTIFVACDNGLRQAHDMICDCCVRQKKCRSILKHVLKCCDNRKSCRRPVVSLSHATKIVPCKSALRDTREMRHNIFTSIILVLSDVDRVLGSILEGEPEQYRIEQLERCLKCRGLKLTGKRDDLFNRVKGCNRSCKQWK